MKSDTLRELTIEENKALLLQGLCEFRKICETNGLSYFLLFGTLLGAVRHKGYIPWDDDIDVGMPRADYEKLIDLAATLESSEWEIVSYRNQPGYCFPWAKFCSKKTRVVPSRFNTGYVYGSSIDVFPLDVVDAVSPEEALKKADALNRKYHQLEHLYRYAGVYTSGPVSSIKRLLKKIHFIYICRKNGSWKKQLREFDSEIRGLSGEHGDFLSYIYTNYATSVFQSGDYFGDGPTLLPFEGELFSVPARYDHILTQIYGDYMTLPPVEKRVVKHTARILCEESLAESTKAVAKEGIEEKSKLNYRIVEKPDWISFDQIADVLHDAHRSNVEQGMRFVASYQDGAETEKRLGEGGKFFVALTEDDTIVGVGAVSLHQSCTGWYGRKQPYGEIKMVGVPEKYKGMGISSALYRAMEEYGFCINELMVMNTAEDNHIVLDSNARHGWIYVDYKSWSRTDYYSPVMAKWKNGCPYSKIVCRIMYRFRRLFTITVRRKNGQQRFLFKLIKNENKRNKN